MEATKKEQPPHHIALLPAPGLIGHLIPFIELAKKLVNNHNCNVTLILVHDGSQMKHQKSLLQGLTINPVFLPPVSVDDLPKDVKPEMLTPVRVIRSLPALRDTLCLLINSSSPPAALFVDLFAPHAIDVAKELGIPAYVFYTASANDLSLSMDLPTYDKSCTSEYRDLPEPIKLPGSIVLRPEDLPDSMMERNNEAHKWVVDLCNKYLSADGIMVNSFLELESEAFKDLKRRGSSIPPVYPVGPLIRRDTSDDHCLKWLSEQPHKSVLFVSFGSGGALSLEQFHELALGLEMSEQRFLWVVRSPQENAADGYLNPKTVSSSSNRDDPQEFLPEGFLEMTKGRGFIVPNWAPQIEVLAHGSTGGFLTHCGWNSILESAVFGVPMIAWPLCFDHKMNAVIVTEGLKAAIRVGENERGIVERGQIASLVKELIEGEEGKHIRSRMSCILNAALEVLEPEGSSTKALAEAVQKWTNGN